ncbi:MAG: ribosomal-protein-alanine N-acetyltransferase [Halomonadaceae bacterium]|nr:MAG: ribosomal-protein-alanine N-acetyltransferase [Halomonadaceae bacterium]
MNPEFSERVALELLQEKDLAAVMHIEKCCYSFPWSQGVFADCLRSGYDLLGAWDNSRLLGYAVLRQVLDEIHLLNLCVAPHCRGQGVARILLRSLMQGARENGAVVVSLEVRASNVAARALYRSEGFMDIALRPDYYPDARGREDGHIMECHL